MSDVARVELQFCCKVSGVGGFRAAETANVLISSVDANTRLPPLVALVPPNPEVTASVVRPWARLILLIHATRHIAKIGDPVVRPHSVDVVNLILRHYAMEMQPCQSVSLEKRSVDHDADVAFFADRSRDSTRLNISATHPPPKNSGVGVVVQHGSKGFDGDVFHLYFQGRRCGGERLRGCTRHHLQLSRC